MIKDLYIHKDLKKVLVKITGESASAILYYIICDYFKDTDTEVIPYAYINKDKPYNMEYVKKIINKVSELTNKVSTEKYLFLQEAEDKNDPLKDILIKEDIQVFYTSIYGDVSKYKLNFWLVRNFKKLNLDVETSFHHLNKRNFSVKEYLQNVFNKLKDILFKTKLFIYKMNKKFSYILFLLKVLKPRSSAEQEELSPYDKCLAFYASIQGKANSMHTNKPFANKDLSYVAKLYKKYGVIDELLPLTFDCKDVRDYETVEDLHHCGYCTNCTERWYGFKKLE